MNDQDFNTKYRDRTKKFVVEETGILPGFNPNHLKGEITELLKYLQKPEKLPETTNNPTTSPTHNLTIWTMYIILVYDMNAKRVGKMLKLCRQYLNWIQNSVFEGEITQVKLKQLKGEARSIMDLKEDSLIIFKSRQEKWLEKEIVGQEKSGLERFL